MATEVETNDETKAAPTPANSPLRPAARTRLAHVRDWLPLAMSVLAFTVSITSLYYAALRGGTVTATTGPMLALGHDSPTGAANVSIAVNLSNTRARLFSTQQLQLLVTAPDGATSATLPAVAQQKFDAKGEPQDDAMVAPITLAPRSETARQLRFTTRPKDVERIDFFHAGSYRFVLWLAVANRPMPEEAERWAITLDDVGARQLRSWSEMGIARAVAVLND